MRDRLPHAANSGNLGVLTSMMIGGSLITGLFSSLRLQKRPAGFFIAQSGAMALAVTFLLSSCASYFVRKDCEKVNWFQYGESVALQGRRLSGDEKILSCEKANADVDHVALDHGFKSGMANYCLPETVFQIGKRGDFFSVEMCDGEQPRLLQKRHADGVNEYCAKTNGFPAGAQGKKYNGICPKELESGFLPEFNRGRKSFLTATIAANESHIDEIENSIRQLDSERIMLLSQMQASGEGKIVSRDVKYDPVTHSTHEEMKVTDDADAQRRRENLKWDLDRKNREIDQKRSEQENLRKANRDMKTEVATLQYPPQ